MTIREVLKVTPFVQNIVVTFRNNGKYVIKYELGEHVTPSKYSKFIEQTEDGNLYSEDYDGRIKFIINVTPFGNNPEKVIPKKILDAEITMMEPFNVHWVSSEHYHFEFECDTRDAEPPKIKRKKSKDDGQMSLDLGEVET